MKRSDSALRIAQPPATAPIRNLRHGSGALTLVEIIVVMAIMTILVSTIVAAALMFNKVAAKKATIGLLEKLSAGLEQYHAEYRMYVPGDDVGSTQPLWTALELKGKNVNVEARYKQQIPGTGIFIYVDSWDGPLNYVCSPPYQTYWIRSCGPDLVDNAMADTDANIGDDIVKQ